jgi:hypothetical protein
MCGGWRCLDHSKKRHIKTIYQVLTLSKHAPCINLIRGFCIFFLLNTRKKIILQHGFNLKHMPPSRKKKMERLCIFLPFSNAVRRVGLSLNSERRTNSSSAPLPPPNHFIGVLH